MDKEKPYIVNGQRVTLEEYRKTKYEDLRVRVPIGRKAGIQAHAEKKGESLNAFIIRAIDAAIQRDNENVTLAEAIKYTDNEVYQELVNICETAGLHVTYKQLNDATAARTDRYTLIEMPDTDIFEDTYTAARVLGHELAHSLIEDMPSESLNGVIYNSSDEQSIDDDCDKIGDALVVLAGNVISRRQKEAWEQRDDVQIR